MSSIEKCLPEQFQLEEVIGIDFDMQTNHQKIEMIPIEIVFKKKKKVNENDCDNTLIYLAFDSAGRRSALM